MRLDAEKTRLEEMALPTYRLSDLARLVGGEVRAQGDPEIEGVASLDAAGPRDLSLVTHPKYRERAAGSKAAALLVPEGVDFGGRPLLVHREPYRALAALLEAFHPPEARPEGIDPSAVVSDEANVAADAAVGPLAVVGKGARIASRAVVGAGCVVGRDAVVGEDSELCANVVLYPRTVVGKRCLVHSGAILGADGFGFATVADVHHKIPQVGRTVIEDDVEIGANSCVDRGALDDTVIGAGSKLDDLVMIGHGVQLGPGAMIVAQSAIAGSTRVGAHSTFAGQSGAVGHLTLGARTTIAAKSLLISDLPDGGLVAGIPAVEHIRWKRAQAALRTLPDLKKQLADMKRRLADLEQGIEKPEDAS
jgi:UDP-3-O-[3-hydroxymyristoyl] glucosamine N-acyltransferase